MSKDKNFRRLYLNAIDYISHERDNDRLQKVKEYIEYRMEANIRCSRVIEALDEQKR